MANWQGWIAALGGLVVGFMLELIVLEWVSIVSLIIIGGIMFILMTKR